MIDFHDQLDNYVKRDFCAYAEDLDPLTISQDLRNLNVAPIRDLAENWDRLFSTLKSFSGEYRKVFFRAARAVVRANCIGSA